MIKGKRILFTGGTGFIGKNVLPLLRSSFVVYAPKRSELDLTSFEDVASFVTKNRIDVILHCANPNPSKNKLDQSDRMLLDSIELFLTIYRCRNLVEKIIYLGSGAVYDKSKDIISAREETSFDSFPKDDYGFAKFIANELTAGNIYNLCVFGCYGPGDAESKFITHCIRCCLRGEPITIRQNCVFDYLHVSDLGKIMSWVISNVPRYNMYNACSGEKHPLLEIAEIVKRKMNSPHDIVILSDGWNREYTGSNDRLREEYHEAFLSLEEGIDIQIEWEKENYRF